VKKCIIGITINIFKTLNPTKLLMVELEFEILPISLLSDYLKLVDNGLQASFDKLVDSELSAGTFSFYTSVSAVFSSK
jgi:hypothetical protein